MSLSVMPGWAVVCRLHTVDKVERRKTSSPAAACAFRRRPCHVRRIINTLDRAADLAAVAEQLERPEIEHRLGVGANADALIHPGVFTLGPLIRSSRRCVSDVPERGVFTTRAPEAVHPCAIAVSVLAVREVLPRTIW